MLFQQYILVCTLQHITVITLRQPEKKSCHQEVEIILIEYCIQLGGVIFLIGQRTAFNQRSGMIHQVKLQIFGSSRASASTAKYHFQKIPGGLNINININIFCENWHEVSFHIT